MDIKATVMQARLMPESKQGQDAIREAGASFERLLIEQMLRSMEESLDGGLLGKESVGGDWYTGMFNQEMSRSITDAGGFGLSDMLLRQFSRDAVTGSNNDELPVIGPARIAGARFNAPDETRVAHLKELVEPLAQELDLDPELVNALIQQESGWDERARSVKGAMGLTQLMPDTADSLGVDNPWDAEQNLKGGLTYLRQMLDEFDGDTSLALAAYNAGPTAVKKYRGIPPYRETQDYVTRILSFVEKNRDTP